MLCKSLFIIENKINSNISNKDTNIDIIDAKNITRNNKNDYIDIDIKIFGMLYNNNSNNICIIIILFLIQNL